MELIKNNALILPQVKARYEELTKRLKSEERKDWLTLAEFYELREIANFLNEEIINVPLG